MTVYAHLVCYRDQDGPGMDGFNIGVELQQMPRDGSRIWIDRDRSQDACCYIIKETVIHVNSSDDARHELLLRYVG